MSADRDVEHPTRARGSFDASVPNAAGKRSPLGFFLPGSIRHWRRISPNLSFVREGDTIREIRLRGRPWLQAQNGRLAALRPPHTLTIVGSGPSIASMDLGLLPPGTTILLNGTISLMPKVQPFAIVIEDRRFVDRHWDMLRDVLPTRPRLIASGEALSAIAERDPSAIRGDVYVNDNLFKPLGRRRRRGRLDFSSSPSQGTIRGGSVAVTAFQWAVAMRPQRIAFAGVELWNADGPRFYEGADMARSGIVRAQDRILHHLDVGTKLAREAGVEIVNLSPRSALETIGIPTIAVSDVGRV